MYKKIFGIFIKIFFFLLNLSGFSERNIALNYVNVKGNIKGGEKLFDGFYTNYVSFSYPNFYLEDGMIGTLTYSSSPQLRDPFGDGSKWVEIEFDKKYKIIGFKLIQFSQRDHGPCVVSSFAVQYFDGISWKEILESYQVRTNDKDFKFLFSEPVETNKIRFIVYSVVKSGDVGEIEIYAGENSSEKKKRKYWEEDLSLLLGEMDYMGAINLLEKIDDPYALVEKAKVYQRIGALKNACNIYEKIIEKYGKNEDLKKIAEVSIADCYFLNNQLETSFKMYESLYTKYKDPLLEDRIDFSNEISFETGFYRPLPKLKIIPLNKIFFRKGDSPDWKNEDIEEEEWKEVEIPYVIEEKGFCWFRIYVYIPSIWKGEKVILNLGKIYNSDQVFLNGKLIGETGKIEPYFISASAKERNYVLPENLIKFDKINIIAIRTYNETGKGGIYQGNPKLFIGKRFEDISLVEWPGGNIFYQTEKIKFKIKVKKENEEKGKIKWILSRKEEILKNGFLEVEGKEKEIVFEIENEGFKNGVYSVLFIDENDNILKRINFALIPEVKQRFSYDSPFGMHGLAKIEDIEACGRIGIKWMRIDFVWHELEPVKGVWNFEKYDKIYQAAKENKIFILATLGYSPSWANKKGVMDRKFFPEWEKYVSEVLTRYGDVIKAIEIGNEIGIGGGRDWNPGTEEDYRELTKLAYNVAKKIDEKIKVVAGNFADHTAAVLWSNPEIIPYFDGDAPHTYSVGDTFFSQTEYSEIFNSKYKKESWLTEFWGGLPEYMSECGIVKQIVMGISNGIDKFFPHHVGVLFDARSLYHRYQSPGASAVSYAVLIKFLEDKKFVGYATDTLPWNFIFEGKENSIAVIWGINFDYLDDVGKGKIVFKEKKIEGYDVFGNKIEKDSNGYLVLPFNEKPFYLIAKDKETLEKAIREAEIIGISPIKIMVEDLQEVKEERWFADIAVKGEEEKEVKIRIILQNLINSSLNGTLIVSSNDIKFTNNEFRFSNLEPGKSKEIFVPVEGFDLKKEKYLIDVKVNTDKGNSFLKTEITKNIISKSTPVIDGNIGDFQGFPIYLSGKENFKWCFPRKIRSVFISKWNEEKKFSDKNAKIFLSYDDENLYIGVEANDKDFKKAKRSWEESILSPDGKDYIESPKWPRFQHSFLLLAINKDKDSCSKSILERKGMFMGKDYEYIFYLTPSGPETYRIYAPGIPLRTLAYQTHRLPFDQGVVKNVKVKINFNGEKVIYEVALPWDEIKEIKPEKGKKIGINVLITFGDGTTLDLGAGKSTTKFTNGLLNYPYNSFYTVESYFTFQ